MAFKKNQLLTPKGAERASGLTIGTLLMYCIKGKGPIKALKFSSRELDRWLIARRANKFDNNEEK